jgi:gamma-glutamylaminecyclotransferase
MANLSTVFVYGTLKRGHHNDHLTQAEGVEYVGRDYIEGNYGMYSLGSFPAVIRQEKDKRKIFGEVYRVPADVLDAMDILEGHPVFYKRSKVQTVMGRESAWVYFMDRDRLGHNLPLIAHGAWAAKPEEKEFIESTKSNKGV